MLATERTGLVRGLAEEGSRWGRGSVGATSRGLLIAQPHACLVPSLLPKKLHLIFGNLSFVSQQNLKTTVSP